MSFPPKIKEEALVSSRRHCCVCRKFGGRDCEVHHIIPSADGGKDDIDNAVALCFRCHSEVGSYNPKHPKGNKYSPSEVKKHRDDWWIFCEENPHVPLPEYPISVSPGVIDFGSAEWKAISSITVSNLSDQVFYQVWIKVGLQSSDVESLDIDLDIEKEKSLLKARVNSIEVSGDVIRYDGIDKSNNKAIYVELAKIDPRNNINFVLRNKSKPESLDGRLIANIAIIDFSSAAKKMMESKDRNKVGLMFSPPEDFTMSSVSMLMQRK